MPLNSQVLEELTGVEQSRYLTREKSLNDSSESEAILFTHEIRKHIQAVSSLFHERTWLVCPGTLESCQNKR